MANKEKELDEILDDITPNDSEINIDSYMESIPEGMRDVFMKMGKIRREAEKNSEKDSDASDNKDEKSSEDSGFTEVVMDQDYLANERIRRATENIAAAQKEDSEGEIDNAIAEERKRLEELNAYGEQGGRLHRNSNGDLTVDGDEDGMLNRMPGDDLDAPAATAAKPNKEDADENNVKDGEILGDLYVKEKTDEEEDAPDYDELKTDDFLPDLDDEEESAPAQEKTETTDDADDIDEDTSALELRYRSEDELEKLIRDTPEVVMEPDKNPIVHVVQKRTESIEVPGNNADRVKELSDDAFITRLNKIRRKNFRVVEVPLLNSGFTVSMNGISPGDLVALYTIVEQHANGGISAMDYLNAQMKTIAKSIVKIEPPFDKSKLHYMIHYADLNMLMYGVVAATLDDAKYPIDACQGCGKSFRITIPSTDIILNKDDVADRADEIYGAIDIRQTSLLEKNIIMRFPSGFEVVLGHASIADQRSMMQAIDRYSDNTSLTEIDKMALLDAATTELPWVKSIVGPGRIKANGPYQTTKLLGLMDDDERRQIVENIRKLQKDLIPVKLGVKNVRCPHCGHIHEQIQIESLGALVFYHKRESSAFATMSRE